MMKSRGFTYLSVLFIIAVITAGLALVGEVWETAAKREKETELLFVGNEYRKAITRYYLAGLNQYPRSVEDLLKDQRKPGTVRHLRRLYSDPVTGKSEWGIVKGSDGGIAGVYSLSDQKPLKIANFRVRDAGFDGAQTYADWKFVYTPVTVNQGAVKPAAPGTTQPAAQPGAPQPTSRPGS